MLNRTGIACAFLLGLIAIAGCDASAGDGSEVAESELDACPNDKHECAAWGATCNGSTLLTCVVGKDGCRKLIEQPCSLGCSAGACETCSAVDSAVRSQSTSPPGFYGPIARRGDVVVAGYRGRNGPYGDGTFGMTTLDVSNPAAVATLATTSMPYGSLTFAGDRLLSVGSDKLNVWDAADLAKPKLRGTYTPADPPFAVAVAGDLGFVLTGAGLDVVDLKTPDPTGVGIASLSVKGSAIAAKSKTVVVAGSEAVEVVDVTDPTQPQLAGKVKIGRIAGDGALAFDGNYAYVLATPPGDMKPTSLFVLAPGPGAPKIVAQVPNLGAERVSLDASRLVVTGGRRVLVFDVSAPSAPKLVEAAILPLRQESAVMSGDEVFTSGVDGVTAIDLGHSPDITMVPAGKSLRTGVTRGSIAYLARGTSFVIEDVHDPAHPVVLSDTQSSATDVALMGSQAVVTAQDTLRVFDIRSPWEPTLLGSVSEKYTMLGDLTLVGTKAFTSCGQGNICVFDLSTPSTPKLVTKSDAGTKGTANPYGAAFAFRDGLAYVSTAENLRVFDFTNPLAPTARGRAGGDSPTPANLAIGPHHAYVSYECGWGTPCIDVFDISNPDAPTKTTTLRINSVPIEPAPDRGVAALHMLGGSLFLTFPTTMNVMVLDLADPAHPVVRTEFYTAEAISAGFLTDRFARFSGFDRYPEAPRFDQFVELCH